MSPQFRVTLTKEEVEELQKISSTGSSVNFQRFSTPYPEVA